MVKNFLIKTYRIEKQKDKLSTQCFFNLRLFVNLVGWGRGRSSKQSCTFADYWSCQSLGPQIWTSDKPGPNFSPKNLKLRTEWRDFA